MAQKSHYKSWLHFAKAWNRYIVPPARPCKSQLKIFEKIIKSKSKGGANLNVLILGATPELRDLCLEYNLKTIVCDINENMVKAMSSVMRYKKSQKEKIMITNWLKTEFAKNSFDFIFGDASLNQILRKGDIIILLKKLRYFLKPQGLLLIREVVRFNKRPVLKNDKLWVKYFNKYQKGSIDRMNLYFFYKYQSNANIFHKSPSLIDSLPMFSKLERLEKWGKLGRGGGEFISWLEKAMGKSPKPLLVFVKKDLKDLLKKYFKLLPIKQCKDYSFCRYMPLILARPRK